MKYFDIWKYIQYFIITRKHLVFIQIRNLRHRSLRNMNKIWTHLECRVRKTRLFEGPRLVHCPRKLSEHSNRLYPTRALSITSWPTPKLIISRTANKGPSPKLDCPLTPKLPPHNGWCRWNMPARSFCFRRSNVNKNLDAYKYFLMAARLFPAFRWTFICVGRD